MLYFDCSISWYLKVWKGSIGTVILDSPSRSLNVQIPGFDHAYLLSLSLSPSLPLSLCLSLSLATRLSNTKTTAHSRAVIQGHPHRPPLTPAQLIHIPVHPSNYTLSSTSLFTIPSRTTTSGKNQTGLGYKHRGVVSLCINNRCGERARVEWTTRGSDSNCRVGLFSAPPCSQTQHLRQTRVYKYIYIYMFA